MKYKIKLLVLFLFNLINKSSNAQYGIGQKISSIKEFYEKDSSSKIQESFDITGNVFQLKVEYDSIALTFIAKSAKTVNDFLTSLPYVCETILFESKSDCRFNDVIENLDTTWVKIKEDKWTIENTDSKYISVAEKINKEDKKQLLINGTYCFEKDILFDIGVSLYSIKEYYSKLYKGDGNLKTHLIYDENGKILSTSIESNDCIVEFISEFSKKGVQFYKPEGIIYSVCDKIVVKSENEIKINAIIDGLNSIWKKTKDDKWTFDDKEKKFKCVAEVVTENFKKIILIKGSYYGSEKNLLGNKKLKSSLPKKHKK